MSKPVLAHEVGRRQFATPMSSVLFFFGCFYRICYYHVQVTCLQLHCLSNTNKSLQCGQRQTVSHVVDSCSLSLSLRFNDHFPGEPGLAGTRMSPFWILFELRMMDGGGGDNWSYKTCKAPVKSSPPTNQHPAFNRPDALPVAKPTMSKH